MTPNFVSRVAVAVLVAGMLVGMVRVQGVVGAGV